MKGEEEESAAAAVVVVEVVTAVVVMMVEGIEKQNAVRKSFGLGSNSWSNSLPAFRSASQMQTTT